MKGLIVKKKLQSRQRFRNLEALEAPMNDTSGDLNADWLFPLHSKLDPSTIPFLWKLMKESELIIVFLK